MSSFAGSSKRRPSGAPQATRAAAQDLVDACAGALDHGLVVVVDAKGEGTLVTAANTVTAALITTMLTHGRGMISVCLTAERCSALGLFRRGGDDPRAHAQPFVTSVDAIYGVTTGISAADRAATIHAVADPSIGRDALREPGHVFVLRGRDGGVSERAGHTEAAIELAHRGGSGPAAVICEILDESGALASVEDQLEVCERLEVPLMHVADLISVLPAGPATVVERSTFELRGSTWHAVRLQEGDGRLAAEHVAVTNGDPAGMTPLVRAVVSKPLARLAGVADPEPLPAADDQPVVLIALGAKRDLRRAVDELDRPGLSKEDGRSIAMVLQALGVSTVREPAPIDAHELERHGISVTAGVGTPQRSARKKSRMSSARSSGSSAAGKCPPRGMTVQRRMS